MQDRGLGCCAQGSCLLPLPPQLAAAASQVGALTSHLWPNFILGGLGGTQSMAGGGVGECEGARGHGPPSPLRWAVVVTYTESAWTISHKRDSANSYGLFCIFPIGSLKPTKLSLSV